MSSCQRFVQNAWKKELCSNCFKSKEEHASVQETRSRYLTSIKNLSNKPPPQSILKGNKVKKSASRVTFPAEESHVIGYGGEEVSDDDDFIENCLAERTSPEEDIAEGEEEKVLQRLTKSNTDFNSNPANLSQSASVTEAKKASFTPLLLGKPLKGADGRKQTLLVSVQPFGSENNSSPLAVSRKAHLNNLLQESKESPKIAVIQNSDSEKIVSKKNGVVLNDTIKSVNSVKSSGFSKIVLSENVQKIEEIKSVSVKNETNDLSARPFTDNEKNNSSTVPTKHADISKQNTVDKGDISEKVHVLELSDLNTSTEIKKSQILRGSVLTKMHDQVKTKRYFSLTNSAKSQEENKKTDLSRKKNNDVVSIKNENDSDSQIVEKDLDTAIKTSVHVQQKNIKNLSGGLFTSRLVYTDVSTSSEESDSSGVETPLEENHVSLLGDKNNLKISVTKESAFPDVNCVKLVLKEVEDTDDPRKRRLSTDKEVTLQVMKILNTDGTPAESREMAGEPDGRADPDENDDIPPEIPSSPPPLLTEHTPRASFLHNLTKEKPKIPVKPKIIDSSPLKEIPPPLDLNKKSQSLQYIDPQLSPTENGRSTKRQAPKPPPPITEGGGVFMRNPMSHTSSVESPVIRQREKKEQRERAASCSPLPSDSSSGSSQTPEPTPRRSLSLSQDSLTSTNIPVITDKKRSNKVRSTLRKFLRLASRDEDRGEEYLTPPPPTPRPRLEIIHPLDLNKSGVQVLRSDGTLVINTKVESAIADSPSPTSPSPYAYPGRPNKPPPPPRSQSLDSSPDAKPARPPPPKAELLNTQRQITTSVTPTDTVYANIGEARSAIAPNKPQRTASIRDSQSKDMSGAEDSHYESVQVSDSQVFADNENLYEWLAPECDLNRERSSLPYCSSETESDIYFPYNFGSTQDGVFKFVGDEESESPLGHKSVRLRARKGRSIVHKSLEENYGAVVVANHEALLQLLEQMNQSLTVPVPLRALKSTPNLQWSDFTINDDSTNVVVGGRVFLNAQWNLLPVTLCLTVGQSRLPNSLSPITQFFDLVASKYVNHEKTELVQVSVAVLVHQQVFTLQSYGSTLKGITDPSRETAMVMVQLINGLKNLQARGIEDTNLTQFVLCRDEREFNPRVCLLPLETDAKSVERVSLCQCAVTAIDALPPSEPLTELLRKVLVQERATSLSQAKAALELWLWGPTQVVVSSDIQENLQRWLDLERATILQSLVINRPPRVNTADYCHLSFLVRTNAKIMADAMVLLEKSDTLSC